MTASPPNLPDQMQSRFGDVCALSAELSMVASFEELCRQAVIRGREVLGFDRIGLWFQTQTPLVVEGSFGTDESGAIRDERGLRLRCAPGSDMGRLLSEGAPTVFVDDAPLLDHHAKVVGHGSHLLASLWDGEKIIGCLSADDLLREHPIIESERSLLQMFATMLGHLCTQRRVSGALAATLEEQRKLLDIVNRSPAMAFRWRIADGFPVEFVSDNVTQLGYTSDDLVSGRVSWPGITHPGDTRRLEAEVEAFLAEGRLEWEQRYRLKTASGDYRWFEDRNRVITDAGGTPTHIEGIVMDITERHTLATRLLAAGQETRAETGALLHDSLGQELAGIAFTASALKKRLSGVVEPEVADMTARLSEFAQAALANVRSIAHGLAPAGITANGLSDALRGLAERISEVFNIDCVYESGESSNVLDSEMAENLYRIAQEATTNAVKHAGASRIEISFGVAEKHSLVIHDNGGGMADPGRCSSSGLGLRLMRHRAEMIGGVVRISSERGSGTTIECILP
jgi:PAS domain S-box-containing protein